jgi:hypothetical protein
MVATSGKETLGADIWKTLGPNRIFVTRPQRERDAFVFQIAGTAAEAKEGSKPWAWWVNVWVFDSGMVETVPWGDVPHGATECLAQAITDAERALLR